MLMCRYKSADIDIFARARARVYVYLCVCARVCVRVCCSPQPACLCAHVLLLVGVEADEQPLVYQQVRQSRVRVDLSRQQQ